MQKARDIGILNKMAYKNLINDPNSTQRMADRQKPHTLMTTTGAHTIVYVLNGLRLQVYLYQFQNQHSRSTANL